MQGKGNAPGNGPQGNNSLAPGGISLGGQGGHPWGLPPKGGMPLPQGDFRLAPGNCPQGGSPLQGKGIALGNCPKGGFPCPRGHPPRRARGMPLGIAPKGEFPCPRGHFPCPAMECPWALPPRGGFPCPQRGIPLPQGTFPLTGQGGGPWEMPPGGESPCPQGGHPPAAGLLDRLRSLDRLCLFGSAELDTTFTVLLACACCPDPCGLDSPVPCRQELHCGRYNKVACKGNAPALGGHWGGAWGESLIS